MMFTVHDDTDIDYNTSYSIYTKSSIIHLSSYYQTIRGQVSRPSSACGMASIGSKAKLVTKKIPFFVASLRLEDIFAK